MNIFNTLDTVTICSCLTSLALQKQLSDKLYQYLVLILVLNRPINKYTSIINNCLVFQACVVYSIVRSLTFYGKL